MMTRQRNRTKKQQGLVAILLLVSLAMLTVTMMTKNLWGGDSKAAQQKVTQESLRQAKEALLNYVATGGSAGLTNPQTSLLGRLPCPDQDGDGKATSALENPCGAGGSYIAGIHSLGLFPWSTLDTPALRDSSRQCLWYAVDGWFKVNAASTPVNADSFGSFTVIQPVKKIDSATGIVSWTDKIIAGNPTTTTANSPNRVVAVIISPGAVGGTQTQSASNTGTIFTCELPQTATSGGNTYPSAENSTTAYLKNYTNTAAGGINANNQTLASLAKNSQSATADNSYKTFVTADTGQEQLNDQVTWITAEEFSQAATKRAARLMASYLNAFVKANGRYPSAALTPGGVCVSGAKPLLQGFIPRECPANNMVIPLADRLGSQTSGTTSNDRDLWLGQAHYAVSQNCLSGGASPCAAGSARVNVGSGIAAPAILLMRGRLRTGQTNCPYTASENFSTSLMSQCLEGLNQTAVQTAITKAANSSSYETNIANATYNVPLQSNSNDFMIRFTAQ